MLSDEALVQRTLREGSHHFGELVTRYADYLFGFGLRLTGGNKELSEDIAQQSFARAFRYLKSFDKSYLSKSSSAEHRFRNWLTGITVNCFNDLIETEQRYQPLEEHLEPTYEARFDDSYAFYQLIKPLNAQDRILFVLRYIYEYRVPEIATLTSTNEGTVKSRISRALNRLRDHHHD
jgi:RNA polymerase sigma-70 factor (ECF subfamily)